MIRYYDQKCLLCEKGCVHFATDAYPDGTPYEACRFYGYILHPGKGVADEDCIGFLTEEQQKAKEEREKRMRR